MSCIFCGPLFSNALLPCRQAEGQPLAHSSPVAMDHDAAEAPPEATAAVPAADMARPRAAPGVARTKPAHPSSSLFFNAQLCAPRRPSEGRMRSSSLSCDQPGAAGSTSGSGLTSSTVCGDGLRRLLDAAELVEQADGGMEETPEPEVHSPGSNTALVVQVSSSQCGLYTSKSGSARLAVTPSISHGASMQLSNQGAALYGWQLKIEAGPCPCRHC